jgi:hypothetical protein
LIFDNDTWFCLATVSVERPVGRLNHLESDSVGVTR